MDFYYVDERDYSYNTLRRILIANNICSAFSYRSTKKKIKYNLQNQEVKNIKTIDKYKRFRSINSLFIS